MSAVHKLHLLVVEEDGSILAFLLAVVASHADIVVAVEMFQHVAQLWMEHLLCTEDVGVFEVDLTANHGATLCPAVTVFVVVIVLIANVVRPYVEGLRKGLNGGYHR